jgi:hypothetical protein
VSFAHQPLGHLAIPIEPLRLEVRPVRSANLRAFIPIETQPPQPVKNSLNLVPRRSLDVSVLNAQDEDAPRAPGVQPVEERRSGTANMKVSGG